MTIYFRNPGHLPIEAITTLGVSVKGNDSPIGRFGTGLKYTIAGILRLRESIAIIVGGKKLLFNSVQRTIRGKVFDIVTMEDVESGEVRDLGFTTDLGPHWEPWMFIRELWSNCKDEGGTYGEGAPGEVSHDETVVVCLGPKIEGAFANMSEFILTSEPKWKNRRGWYHGHAAPGQNDILFYQGIRVFKSETKPFKFTWNLQGHFDLTEDRTAVSEYWIKEAISTLMCHCPDRKVIETFLTLKEGLYIESDCPVYVDGPDTPAYEVLKQLWENSPVRLSPQARRTAAQTWKPSRDSIRFTPTTIEKAKFERALTFLHKLGCDKTVKWNFVDPLDSESFGFVESGEIYITRAAFSSGTQFLAQVMLEEYVHKVHRLDDYSRSLQDWLFAKIISLGEEVSGEPL